MDAISSAAARPPSSPALNGLSPARISRGAVALTFALLVLIASAGAQNASACVSSVFSPLALSTFEAADGDQCDSDGVGPKRDWQTVAGNVNLHTTIDSPSANDTTYGSNNAGIVGGSTNELVPDSWNFTFGNIGGGKFDALSATSFTDPENNKLFLDLGFIRATTTGDTFLAFELNQRQPGYRLDPNEADATKPFRVPTRTSGDLLVTYHVGTAGAEEIGLCAWDGNEHSGRWEEFAPDLEGAPITNQACPALSTSLYQAAINDGQSGRQGAISGAENYLAPGTPVSAGQFGEAVVDLTDALRNPADPTTGPQPCVDFGYVWLHSRSSDSLTSNQQDVILPANSISIGSCTVEGAKFNDLDGNGSRSAGEPYLGGWTMFVDYDNDGILDNDKDATFVNDLDGIIEAGEEEPYDVTADGTGTEPLGSYRITKVQPSNHSDPAGTWAVREILQPTWECTAAVGGGAVVGPDVCPEDTPTNPGSALGFRLAWNDNQTYSGRDFGNRRQPARLKVVKHVVNDDGGTKLATDFSLTVDDPGSNPAAFAGAEAPGTNVVIDPGAYSVSEGAHDGYAVSYSAGCTGTLAIGETKTCTVTNDDIAPVLKVVKHVVNDDGGSKIAADFSLTVDDPGSSPAAFAGAEAPGTAVTIDPGEYAVSEGAHDGYAVTYSPDCTSSLAIGETKTCTVTNDDIAPVLSVVKHVVNDDGGTKSASDFSLTIADAGKNPAPFDGAEAPGTDVAIDAGAYSVSEGAHDGYAVSYSEDCMGTLAIGETKTCTVTNDDIAPELTVIKQVVNRAGSTGQASDFTMHVTGNPSTPDGFAGAGAPGVTKTLAAGPYEVSETGAATDDYTPSRSADCSGTLAIGDKKTCTITNTRKTGSITVRKNLVPADDGGLFDLTLDGQVVREDASDGDGETIEVATGTHTVGEQAGSAGALSNYVSSIACGDREPVSGRGPLEVRVGDGDELTCTITNTRRATITVRTITQPDEPGKVTSFGFSSGLPETPGPIAILLGGLFSIADGDSVSTLVAPGERSVTEDNPAPLGYKLIGLTCTEDKAQNSTVSTGAALSTDRTAAIMADPGESIVCTFTNRRVVGQAVVVKAGDTFAYHGDSASYTFAVSNPGNSSLHDVQVSDDKCPNVSAAPTSRQNDNGDALLDPSGADATKPEVWIYTCSYTIGAHAGGETNPVVNTATVTGVDELDRPVGDTDQHTTTLLHPAIALTKTGPATAAAGSRVVYTLAAKNTGDVAFAAALVVVTDARCEAPPLLIGTGGDGSPGTLDPGDTWQYACAVQSAIGERAIHNLALADGTDVNGRHAKAQATADTVLVAPAPPAQRQAVAANVGSGDQVLAPASAKLRGPTGCMPRTAKVVVTGKRISRVTFTLDGRAKRTVRKADRAGRYTYSVRKAKVRTGTHRVRARVVYRAGSSATAKTLVMSLNKCRPPVVKPAFTG